MSATEGKSRGGPARPSASCRSATPAAIARATARCSRRWSGGSTFDEGDLNYLANLCHNCGACFYACQYAPPHEFAVNVPQTFAEVRTETYAKYAWPSIPGRRCSKRTARGSLARHRASLSCLRPRPHRSAASRGRLGRAPGPRRVLRASSRTHMVGVFGAAFLYASSPSSWASAFWRDMRRDAGRLRRAQPFCERGAGRRSRSSISTAAATAAPIPTSSPRSRGAASTTSRSTASCCASRRPRSARSITTPARRRPTASRSCR